MSSIELPSNKKFGFFFTFIFAVIGVYFYYSELLLWSYAFIITSFIFLLISLIRSNILLPLNRLWMRIGILIGNVVSPIVLGVIFFGLFTSSAIFMRLIGRDELRLKFVKRKSYWISRKESTNSQSFENQF